MNIKRILIILATTGLFLSLLMTCLSAFIRLSDANINCSPWPDCQAIDVFIDQHPGITITPDDSNQSLRKLHRLTASLFGIVALLLMMLSLWYRKKIETSTLPAMTCFALTILLAIVGMNTPDLLHPIITLINLSGGMLLTTILWLLLLQYHNPYGETLKVKDWLNLNAIILVFMAIVSGAWVSGNLAMGTCPGFFSCEIPATANFLNAFDITRELGRQGNNILLSEAQLLIERGHHGLAVFTGLYIVLISIFNYKISKVPALIIIALTMGLIIPGAITSAEPSLLTLWLHNFWSLLLILAVAYQYHRVRQTHV